MEACEKLAIAEPKYFEWRHLNPEATELDEREFKRCCGHDEASAATDAANDQLERSIENICEVRAHTLRGLIAKARAADLPDGNGEDVAWSMVDDLVAMGAVQS